jgi:hypothetical protein
MSVAFAAGYMSVAFADDIAGASANPVDVCMLDSLITFPLASDTSANYWGYGVGAWPGDSVQATFARNVIVQFSHRCLVGDKIRAQFINNICYGGAQSNGATPGPGATAGYGWLIMGGYWISDGSACNGYGNDGPECKSELVYLNNRYISNEGTGSLRTLGAHNADAYMFWIEAVNDNVFTRGDKMWLEGNDGLFESGTTMASGQMDDIYWNVSSFSAAQVGYAALPSWHTDQNFNLLATATLRASIMDTVGARPVDRDAVDIEAIAELVAADTGDTGNMGSRIIVPSDRFSDLTLAENTRAFTLPASHNDVLSDGRTVLEHTLEAAARALEP